MSESNNEEISNNITSCKVSYMKLTIILVMTSIFTMIIFILTILFFSDSLVLFAFKNGLINSKYENLDNHEFNGIHDKNILKHNIFVANEALKLGKALSYTNREEASLFYINSISNNPDNIDAIKEYVSLVTSNLDNYDNDIKNQIYENLMIFLNQIVVKTSPSNIKEISKLIDDVNLKNSKLQLGTDDVNQIKIEDTSQENNSNIRIEDALKLNPNNMDELDKNINILEKILSSQNLLNNSDNNIVELKTNYNKMIINKECINILNRTQSLISQAENESNTEYAGIMLNAAGNNIASLIVSQNELNNNLKANILAIKTSFDDASAKLQNKIYQSTVDRYNNINIDNIKKDISLVSNCKKTIDVLQNVANEIQNTNIKNKNDYINSIIEVIEQLRAEQSKRYNQWAIGQIKKTFYVISGKKTFATTEWKNSVAMAMKENLGKIRPEYLSIQINNAYQTVFNSGYNSLIDDVQKLDVDQNMWLKKKKELNDF